MQRTVSRQQNPEKRRRPATPNFRTEDMFMAGALLGRAFQITSESRYVDLLMNFIVDGNIQQDNGLFWHCRSAPFYWGRGATASRPWD